MEKNIFIYDEIIFRRKDVWLIICDVENLKKKYSDFKYKKICR